jgi:AraC-like DNA-binding protein
MSTRRSSFRPPFETPILPDESGARIVAWSAGEREHERFIARTLAHVARIVFCRSEPALFDELAKGSGAVVLVELGETTMPAAPAVVHDVKRRFPSVLVVGHCWLGPAASAEIVASSRAGLDALALRGYDDLAMTMRRALARERGDDAVVLLELESMVPAPLLRWAGIVLDRVGEGPSVHTVARALGCGPRTLERMTQSLGVASPARLIGWMRLLYAARLLAVRRLDVDEVASRAGYPSSGALRRAFRRERLAPPGELRSAARYATVREALRRQMRALDRPAAATVATRCARPFATAS